MAKKNLTPEELQAKMEKKSSKGKVFFGTFTKALAVFLAIVVAWALVSIAFTTPSVGGSVATSAPAGTSSQGGSATTDDNLLGDDTLITDDPVLDDGSGDAVVDGTGDATTPGDTSGDASQGGNAAAPAAKTKAEVAKLLNEVTKNVPKMSYKWTRKCWFTKPIDVGSATDTLNGIIQGIDPNASIDSVVGNFLGITGKESDPAWENKVTKGAPGENMPEKYLMKAFALTESDIKALQVSGNTYTMQLNACKNPQKDNSNPLSRVTNDFITLKEVQEGVQSAAGSLIKVEACDVDFTAILVKCVVENNKLVSYSLSYTMTVNSLNLKATLLPITGTGAGKMECSYFNFS